MKGHEAPLCDNCGHRYGEHDGFRLGRRVERKHEAPNWGGECGHLLDFHHTCACRRYYLPERESGNSPLH